MSESGLGIYDANASSNATAANATTRGHDEAADERIAEEFKREFLASLEEKRVLKPPPMPGQGAGKGGVEVKGPKLGGSRQQRAAMREVQERAAAKGKK